MAYRYMADMTSEPLCMENDDTDAFVGGHGFPSLASQLSLDFGLREIDAATSHDQAVRALVASPGGPPPL